eukprot:CAMPEP_0175983812 /NCGR_PEP_ID=MMETSP0108-20121206/48663_1 /TAXON_ID=195067 ORGANISM="Goniomonas pacifica, Strain CCMP1869" /NCGR_SAMPLE_ID=MMETSP0108 /ASSEMBLY_ACC=CAM_ASM_000204 /LENGTH=34 /DNA_ID= /DNA_START= /DNA_END= /DNA_ORIENTATION=
MLRVTTSHGASSVARREGQGGSVTELDTELPASR